MTNVRLRKIEMDDNQAMRNIIQTSLESFGLDQPGTAYFDPELKDLYSAYQNEGAQYWVVDLDGQVAGGIGVGPYGNNGQEIAELQKLYVSEAFRGRGFSRLLIDQATAFAEHYYDVLYLETSTQLGVDTLYEHFGFQAIPGPIIEAKHSAMDLFYVKKLK